MDQTEAFETLRRSNSTSRSTTQTNVPNKSRPTMIPISVEATILAHRIQKECRTAKMAMDWMEQVQEQKQAHAQATQNGSPTTSSSMDDNLQWEPAYMAALQICGKTRDYQSAVQIVLTKIPHSEQCRALAISICGRNKAIDEALSLLWNTPSNKDMPYSYKTPAPYHSAIAACGTSRKWQAALDVVQTKMPSHLVTSMTMNAVLTALAKSQRGNEALHFLKHDFDKMKIHKDRTSYHHTMAALLAQSDSQQQQQQQGGLDQAIDLVLTEMTHESNPDVRPNQETYDRLSSAILGIAQRRKGGNHHRGDNRDSHNNGMDEKYKSVLAQLQQAASLLPSSDKSATKKNKLKRKHANNHNANTTTETTETTLDTSNLHNHNHRHCHKDDTDNHDTVSSPPTKRRRITTSSPPEEVSHKKDDTITTSIDNNYMEGQPRIPLVVLPWTFHQWNLPKHGKGKYAYWELGEIVLDNHNSTTDSTEDNDNVVMVGLHPHRNPSKNGIQLWFLQKNTTHPRGKRKKLGYLLMINTPNYSFDTEEKEEEKNKDDTTSTSPSSTASTKGTSQFLGLRVTDDVRQQGLAKIMMATWLQCCLDANLRPTTGIMNKPLLCLVLQHTFQFTCMEQSGGVRAKVLPPPNLEEHGESSSGGGMVRLTPESSAVKNLEGALTPRDLQEQKIRLVPPTAVAPEVLEKGRSIDVGGLLEAPTCPVTLRKHVDKVLQSRWTLGEGIETANSSQERHGDAAKDTAPRPASNGNTTAIAVSAADADVPAPVSMSRLLLGI